MRNNKEENKWKNGEVGGDAFLTDICKRVFAVVEHLTGNTNTLADSWQKLPTKNQNLSRFPFTQPSSFRTTNAWTSRRTHTL